MEDFSDTRKFDLIIFQESAQYIDTASLFIKASDLLTGDGQIIIMDEMSLYKISPSEPSLPLMNDYISQGNKSGFDLIEQLDLSSQALPTNAYIVDAVMRYRKDLVHDLDVSLEEIDGLINAAQIHLTKYCDGRYGYGFLHFKKKSPEPSVWLSDLAHPEDEAELLDLFRAAFGQEMAPGLWRWKYQDLDTLGTIVRREGRLVAFYGGMPRTIHLFGSPATGVQIGDVMVHPKQRGILTRKGPFFQAAANFLEHFVGQGKDFPIAFGFPSERAYCLAEHLGLYEKVGELMCVSWPALQARPSYKLSIRPLSYDKGVAVDRLWREMAAALQDQAVGVRDWSYVKRRYLQHPTVTYQLYLVSSRLIGTPVGIMVIHVLEDAVELLDIIAPPRHMATLVHCLRRLTWRMGKPQAYTWITSQHAQLLAGDSGKITPTGIIIPHNRWTPGISANELMNRWWLTGGDTDLR